MICCGQSVRLASVNSQYCTGDKIWFTIPFLLLQTSDDTNVMLNGFGTVVNSLGQRVKPYLPQICGTIKWRLNNKSAKVRQQAADLIARIAVVMKACHEEQLMGHLGVVSALYCTPSRTSRNAAQSFVLG